MAKHNTSSLILVSLQDEPGGIAKRNQLHLGQKSSVLDRNLMTGTFGSWTLHSSALIMLWQLMWEVHHDECRGRRSNCRRNMLISHLSLRFGFACLASRPCQYHLSQQYTFFPSTTYSLLFRELLVRHNLFAKRRKSSNELNFNIKWPKLWHDRLLISCTYSEQTRQSEVKVSSGSSMRREENVEKGHTRSATATYI